MNPLKTHILTVVFFLMGLILSGCVPATPIAPTVTPMRVSASTNLPTATQPESTPLPPTPPPLTLNSETELVFTIRNDEPASPVMGTPWPDWLAWGPQDFTVAPDGSFWILDTTTKTTSDTLSQPRLLHYSPDGELVKTISLEGKVPGAVDVAVTEDKVWLWTPDLGGPISPGSTGQIVELDWNGQLLNTYEILWELICECEYGYPEDVYLGKEGELLVRGRDEFPFLQILDAEGNVSLKILDGYLYGTHLYKIQPGQSALLFIDDLEVEIKPAMWNGQGDWSANLLGVTQDGNIFVSVVEWEGSAGGSRYVEIVQAYSPDGKPLGVALPPVGVALQPEGRNHLALGPDGSLYALISKEDHSVDIFRVGFSSQLPPFATKIPTPTPIPLTPLLPAWTTPPPGAIDLEIARETVLAFFTALHDGRYAEAAGYYGGDYDVLLRDISPDVDPNDYALLWEGGCNYLQCFLVSNIAAATQTAPDEFSIIVEFMWDYDGSRIHFYTACCGGNMADGAVYWQFPYTVKKIEGEMKVMGLPLYLP